MNEKKTYYITGCKTSVEVVVPCENLAKLEWPGLGLMPGLTPALCETGYLAGATSTEHAKEVCRSCPKASVQPYLEAPPPAYGDAPTGETIHLPTATAPELPGETPHNPSVPSMGESAPGGGDGGGGGDTVEEDDILNSPLWGAPALPPPPDSPPLDPLTAAVGPVDGRQEGWGGMKPAVSSDGGEQSKPRLTRLLAGHGGPTIFGTTAMRRAMGCLRLFYWYYIMGLELPREPERVFHGKIKFHPLDLGAIEHAMMEDYLCSGFDPVMGLRCLDQIKPYYPAIAAEGARLFHRYIDRFRVEDERTWDVRAVELELRHWFPARKVAGAKRQMVLTCRLDALLRILKAGMERLPLGERSDDPLDTHDLKTIARVDSAPAGYRHELQVLQEMLCAQKGYWMTPDGQVGGLVEETYGTVRGFVVTWIGKAVETFDPRKHTGRADYVVEPWMLEEFEKQTEDWLYHEVGERLWSPNKDKIDTWPKCYASCRDPKTGWTCEFISLCEAQHPNPAFTYLKKPPLDPAALAPPKKKRSRKKGGAPAEGENK